MTIHDMLNSAATDIRAMEIRIQTLEQQVKATERDNVRLRESLAASDTARVHAQADLIHYQNIFKASACVEAMKMCQKFFEVTHAGMREEAEAAVQRMVEDKIEKDREEAAAKTASDINDEDRFQELAPTAEQVQTALASVPQDGAIVVAPRLLTELKSIKAFYRKHLGFVPSNYSQYPTYQYHADDGKWLQTPPSFLSNREPRVETRGGVSRAVLAVFGG